MKYDLTKAKTPTGTHTSVSNKPPLLDSNAAIQ